jgi:hypothetical protein
MVNRISPKELVKRYGEDYKLSYKFGDDMNLVTLLYRRDEDYLMVTTEGEEYNIKLETLDKVRDIRCGNMRSLTDYEAALLEKFSEDEFLELLSEESMMRFLEKETGHKVSDVDLLASGAILRLEPSQEWTPDLTQRLVKMASDRSFDRKKFLEKILHKKRKGKEGGKD